MSLDSLSWRGRRKRLARRMARDLRISMPGLGLVLCFASAATTIAIAEAMPVGQLVSGSFSELHVALGDRVAEGELEERTDVSAGPPPPVEVGESSVEKRAGHASESAESGLLEVPTSRSR